MVIHIWKRRRFARSWLGVDRFTSLPVVYTLINNKEIQLVSPQYMKKLSNLKGPKDALVVWVPLLISEMDCHNPGVSGVVVGWWSCEFEVTEVRMIEMVY